MLNKYWKRKGFLSGMRTFLSSVAVFGVLFLPALLGNSVFATNHSISLSTDSDISIDALSGKSTIHASSVNVTTTCKAGYDLMLSTSGNDNHLYPNGDSSSSEGTYFNPSDGSTTLNNAADTWGYSLDISSGTPATLTPPTANNVFLSVPTVNHTPASIRTTRDTASETNIDDDISIYYGVNASYNLAGGTYQMKNNTGTNNPGSIVYYVMMNPICAVDLELGFNENLDGAGAEGTDNTIANFPTENDNTADVANNTLTLSSKVPARSGYVFIGWNTAADGTGTSYQPGAVIRIGSDTNELTGSVTLYATWEVGTAYVVTLSFNEQEVDNVEFHHTSYTTQEVTENGGMVVIRANESYSFIINYKYGYKTNTITTTANGTIGTTTVSGITYTATGDDTITITASQKTWTTTLSTGQSFNTKIKTLAEGKSVPYDNISSKIKAVKMASFLPTGFSSSSSNTVSTSGPPVFIFFDNTNDAGIMYFYTEARDVYMNADSSYMFNYVTALTDISALSNWNTSNVTNMSYMFHCVWPLTDISALSDWDTSSVTDMSYMFRFTLSLTDISPLSDWDTSSVTNMSHLFDSDAPLTDISALASWDTSKVTNMSYMFSNAYSLTDISPLSDWDTSKVTDMSYMFSYTHSLTDISALADWDTSSVTSMSKMFQYIYSLTDISALADWDTSKVTNMSYMFESACSLTDISALADWDTSKVTNMSYMFRYAYSLTDISGLSGWDTGSVTNMSYMFSYAYSLTDISGLSGWDTGSVTNMSYMFSYAYSLTDISGLSGWDTGSVTNMSYMFQYAVSLTNISALSNWDTSSVTDMSYMFYNAYSLANASAIDGWGIRTVTATAGSSSSSSNKFLRMFYGTPTHPNFIKRLGTWNNGTFITASDTTVTVTVDLDDHIKAVSFTDSTYGTRTVTKDGGTIVIPSGVQQDITVSYYDDGYTFDAWSITNGTLGSTSSSTTTLTASSDTTLAVTSNLASTSTVTISPDAHFSSIIIKNPNYGTKTITSSDINNNNNTVTLINNLDYSIIVNYEKGYKTNAITTTANGTLGNTTVSGITYTITGNDTITITTSLKTGTTTLDTGSTFNTKIKTLAEGKYTSYSTSSSKIKALRMASFLPSDFTPDSSNTVSAAGSQKPIYIFFDNINDAGIMYFYTEAHDVYMNASSHYMLASNSALIDISVLSDWDTSSVTNMGSMFSGAFSLTDISALADWNTSSVTNMSSMFSYAYSLTNISALAGWGTGSVTNMSQIFSYAYSLTNISALAGWNTDSVTNMSYMFDHAYSLTDISGLSGWDTRSVTNMSSMFSYAYSLTNISALSNWNTSSVTNMGSMFSYAYSLTNISALSNWNTSSVTDMSGMFSYAYSLTNISALAGWGTGNVTNMKKMFQAAYSINNISALANWNTSSVTDMSGMFYVADSITDISALANWNTSNVTNMNGMFYNAGSLTDISPLSNWDTGNVTDMSQMFYNAQSLINVSAINDWDIRAVSSNKFYYMFYDVPAHPNFTMRAGTWNSYGTFIPSS